MHQAPIGSVRPLVRVAHRAGNHLHLLAEAEAAGVELVEADIWFHRKRLEVRHVKTMGPLPLLWDRWKLESGLRPRLLLDHLVAAAAPTTELMLDLKGGAQGLAEQVVESMQRLAPGCPYTVASQWWEQLESFRALPHVRVIHSIGSARRVAQLEAWLQGERAEAVAINERLLTPVRLGVLRELSPIVFTWTVNDPLRYAELVAWGVDGIISDDYALLANGRPGPHPS